MIEIIKFLGGTTVLLLVIAWLIRTLVKYLLEKDINGFKQKIQAEAEKELTILRSSLELENAKLQTKLTVLEGRRISFIEELYGRLVKVYKEADCFAVELTHFKDNEEQKHKANQFIDTYFEFYEYFDRHEIFIPKNIANQNTS